MKGQRVVVKIESLAFGGDAVGHDADGRVVFVPAAAPGDEVEVVVTEERRGWARGEPTRIVTASTDRVEPACPRFAEGCGGCQWPHVTMAAQQAAKHEIVRNALRHVVENVDPLVVPTPAWRWRRRARLHWGRRPEGTPVVIGYTARRSHRLLAIGACPQLEAPLEAALAVVGPALAPHLFGAGELWLLAGGQGAVHVVVAARGIRYLEEVAREIVGRAGIAGAVLRDGSASVALGAEEIDMADEAVPFWAAADSFAQASAQGNAALRRLVLAEAAVGPSSRVLELYAGSANFTRDLAARAGSVVAVEEVAPAVELGRRNLASRGLADRVRWVRGRVERAVAAEADGQFDVVLLDPPRAGVANDVIVGLARVAPARIVYVSCDPATLARDIVAITGGRRYRVVKVIPVDLMPQTYHVEVVVTLEKTS